MQIAGNIPTSKAPLAPKMLPKQKGLSFNMEEPLTRFSWSVVTHDGQLHAWERPVVKFFPKVSYEI